MSNFSYEPWNALHKFQDDINRLFAANEGDASRTAPSHWSPAVDIREDATSYTLLADVPGIDVKDIEITMENGVLTLTGHRETVGKDERDKYSRTERVRGAFHRRFTLPDTADVEKITAKSANGVLELVIPKHEKLQPRKIVVEG